MSDCSEAPALQERENLCILIGKLLNALEHNSRSDKLPSALFDRLLCSLFERSENSQSTFCSSGFYKEKSEGFFDLGTDKERRYFIRFLIRMFGDLASDSSTNLNLEAEKSFFLSSAALSYDDTSIASSWLQACTALVELECSRSWLFSNGCVIHVLTFLQHTNFYVSRNAAFVVSALLFKLSRIENSFNDNRELITDLLTALFGNVLQFDLSEANGQISNKIPEHCAVESARVIVEFTEVLHKNQHFDTFDITAAFGMIFSKEEALSLIHLATRFKRLQDSCIAIYCVFADNSFDQDVLSTGEYIARASLRRLKISSMLQKDPAIEHWHRTLGPLSTISPASSHLSSFVTSVANFLKSCENLSETEKDNVLPVCLHFTTFLRSHECSEVTGLSCLRFLSASTNFFTGAKNSIEFSSVISQMVNAAELNIAKNNSDRFLVELLRESSYVISCFSQNLNDHVTKESERFLALCNRIETSKIGDFSPAVLFASAEAVLTVSLAFSPSFTKISGLVSSLKMWTLSAVQTLSRCVCSTVNFEDVLGAYGHSSRFSVLSRLILSPCFYEDIDFVAQIFKIMPLESLSRLTSLAFPAIRRAVVAFVFTVSHLQVAGNFHVIANKMLTNLLETSFYEHDNSVDEILTYWSSQCKDHSDPNCSRLAGIWVENEPKEPRKLTERDRLVTAIRVSEDVLAFLHFADDLPCVFIGSSEDGDQDNLDCEES